MQTEPPLFAAALAFGARRTAHRAVATFGGRRSISFLHIGKAAGTQIAEVARRINRESRSVRILKEPHAVRLGDLSWRQDYFFSIRAPASRFRSGFYSRKREGRPRYHYPWTVYERVAFEEFEHANDLAEALFEDSARGGRAAAAMKAIQHAAMDQIDWFEGTGTFLEVRPPVAIIRQEHFEPDLRLFLDRIGFDGVVEVSSGDKAAHANDYSGTPPLSERALGNLTAWYRQDVEFYRMCERWIEQTRDRTA